MVQKEALKGMTGIPTIWLKQPPTAVDIESH